MITPAGNALRSVLPAIAAILFYYLTMKVVQQLTCLTLVRPDGPAYSTGELLNTLPDEAVSVLSDDVVVIGWRHRAASQGFPAVSEGFPGDAVAWRACHVILTVDDTRARDVVCQLVVVDVNGNANAHLRSRLSVLQLSTSAMITHLSHCNNDARTSSLISHLYTWHRNWGHFDYLHLFVFSGALCSKHICQLHLHHKWPQWPQAFVNKHTQMKPMLLIWTQITQIDFPVVNVTVSEQKVALLFGVTLYSTRQIIATRTSQSYRNMHAYTVRQLRSSRSRRYIFAIQCFWFLSFPPSQRSLSLPATCCHSLQQLSHAPAIACLSFCLLPNKPCY